MVFWGVFTLLLVVTLLFLMVIRQVTVMPGVSFRGPLPPLTEHEIAVRDRLRRDVETLAGEIGERNVFTPDKLNQAADFIEREFSAAGFRVARQSYDVAGITCFNLEVELSGNDRADEIVIVGAHYDSVHGCPAANDNASGVAGMLALARAFASRQPARTLRFVAFANEEPPHFWTENMGSLVYARRCRRRGENVVGMFSLETIGYYSDRRGSQKYPFPLNLFYPSTGNFVGFAGNTASGELVRETVGRFRARAAFPSQGAVLPAFVREAGWSDHWSFWQQGYPALMVTDTAPFRYPYYHTPNDKPDQLDYDRMARVVLGLEKVIADLIEAK